MEKPFKIDAVEFTRRIRDRHVKLLKGKSNNEIIAFYRESGKETLEQLKRFQIQKPKPVKRIRIEAL
jgi:hypothetical protein